MLPSLQCGSQPDPGFRNNNFFRNDFSRNGFSIIEVLIVIAILGILFSIAGPAVEKILDERDFAQAKQDILGIQAVIDKFYIENNRFPDSLDEINQGQLRDPWGSPYYYLVVATYDKKSSESRVRRDKKLKPVNSDYDLYSAGKDQLTKAPFTAAESQDDIVRCNNGKYLDFAGSY
ncbi:MAG: type II secretion system GspH family protein [Gammaproteobacteria bacterium]|nr:type II secretion system GspH family protein [Gammaproteobacteria bacterium]